MEGPQLLALRGYSAGECLLPLPRLRLGLAAGSGVAEVSRPYALGECPPLACCERENRAVRVLAVAHGDHGARQSGHLYAVAVGVTVGGLDPAGGLGVHGMVSFLARGPVRCLDGQAVNVQGGARAGLAAVTGPSHRAEG